VVWSTFIGSKTITIVPALASYLFPSGKEQKISYVSSAFDELKGNNKLGLPACADLPTVVMVAGMAENMSGIGHGRPAMDTPAGVSRSALPYFCVDEQTDFAA
jgi:hypothetical protein